MTNLLFYRVNSEESSNTKLKESMQNNHFLKCCFVSGSPNY